MIAIVHLARTGGTSLMLALRLAQYRVFNIGGTEDAVCFLSLPPDKRSSYDFVLGHMPFGIHEVVPEITGYATILRDPISRTILAYNYIKMTPKHAHHREVNSSWSLRDYAMRPGVRNEQSWWLGKTVDWCDLSHALWPDELVPDPPIDIETAKARLAGMSFIGFLEHHTDSVKRFSRAFGLRELPKVHDNRSVPPVSEMSFDPATRAALYEGSRIDAALLAYARTLPGASAGAVDPV